MAVILLPTFLQWYQHVIWLPGAQVSQKSQPFLPAPILLLYELPSFINRVWDHISPKYKYTYAFVALIGIVICLEPLYCVTLVYWYVIEVTEPLVIYIAFPPNTFLPAVKSTNYPKHLYQHQMYSRLLIFDFVQLYSHSHLYFLQIYFLLLP